ncbi:hypothetical protein NEFER03_1363 [Nematocida sp. LUAm3]|nr:hypothetical protein NEFER03_1363 [Nematocida sp. LUAm3]KAI5174014.1 hypothetical protein NEFER02_0481 [Nematocida sp. LUAm2]KAI5177242.1 hypothetical protein NEFER01_0517 [Nematocida sp. LUAm1]
MQQKDSSTYISNKVSSEVAIVYVGGLGGNPMEGYVKDLLLFGETNKIRVFSLSLRSMPLYQNFLIEDDVSDLHTFYKNKLQIYKELYIIGFSTGAQILMLWCSSITNNVTLILHGPVSDREYEESVNKELPLQLRAAEQSKGFVSFPRHPKIRAERFLSLFKKGGTEDIFSVGQKVTHLNPNRLRIFSLVGEHDEYIVTPRDTYTAHLYSIPGMQKVSFIPGDHALSDNTPGVLSFIQHIIQHTNKQLTNS